MGDGSMGRWVIGHWPGAVLQGSSRRLRRTTSPGVRPGQGIQLAQYPVSRIPLSRLYPFIPYPISHYPVSRIPLSRLYPVIPYPLSPYPVSRIPYPGILYRVSPYPVPRIPYSAYRVSRIPQPFDGIFCWAFQRSMPRNISVIPLKHLINCSHLQRCCSPTGPCSADPNHTS
jgi:hypothetical protein